MKGWEIVYETFLQHQALIVSDLLQSLEIESIVLNQQDSVYTVLNTQLPIQIFVKQDDVLKAKHHINQLQLE